MVKSIFFLFLGMLATVLFDALFLYLFANSVQMVCENKPDNILTCTIEKKLFDRVMTSRRTVTGVVSAHVVETCDEGCSYRVELRTSTGRSEPFDDVYTDYQAMKKLADQINAKIGQRDGPSFSIKAEMQWWVLILLLGLGLIGLGIQLIAVFRTAYRWAVSREQG